MTITQKTPDQIRNLKQQAAAIIEKGFLRPSNLLSFLLDIMHGFSKMGTKYTDDHATALKLVDRVFTQWGAKDIDTLFAEMPDNDFTDLIYSPNLYSLAVAAITCLDMETDESLPRHYQYIQSLGYISTLFELCGVDCDKTNPAYYEFPPTHKS